MLLLPFLSCLLQLLAEQLIGFTGADPALIPLAAAYIRIRAWPYHHGMQSNLCCRCCCSSGLGFRLHLIFSLSLVLLLPSLQLFAEQLIGFTGADPALIPLAAAYMRIRAWAAPAVLTIMVCQAAQLSQQDSTTPAITTALSIAVSLLGNLVAVAWLKMGLVGAAATTVATQFVGAVALIWLGQRQGLLRPKMVGLGWKDVLLFGSTMGPLSVAYLCKNLCYILLQTTAASLDLIRLAAHQVTGFRV